MGKVRDQCPCHFRFPLSYAKIKSAAFQRRNHAAVDQQIGSRDKSGVRVQQGHARRRNLVRCSGAANGGTVNHVLIGVTRRIELVIDQRRHDDAGSQKHNNLLLTSPLYCFPLKQTTTILFQKRFTPHSTQKCGVTTHELFFTHEWCIIKISTI